MHPSFPDRYSRLGSPIHQLPTWLKLTATLATVAAILAAQGPCPFIWTGAAALLLTIAALSKIPPGYLLRRMLVLEVFVLGVAGLSMLQPDGFAVFLGLMAKSALCLFAIVLFSNTTPFAELLETLRRWKVPALVVTLLALMYRYLFLFVDELERMRHARMSRTFVNRPSRIWQLSATIVAQLFVRSVERAERIYAAMCARGWQ